MAITFASGMLLTPARLNALIPVTAEKALDTTRTSTITRTADPDLVLALAANSVYDFYGELILTSAANAAGDFAMEMQYPSGASCTLTTHGLDTGLAAGTVGTIDAITQSNQDATSPTGVYNFGCSTTQTSVRITGRITVGATAGNLTLAWAQQTSNASGTTLQNGSFITARRLS